MIILDLIEQQIAQILVEGAQNGRTVTFTEIMQRVHIGMNCLLHKHELTARALPSPFLSYDLYEIATG